MQSICWVWGKTCKKQIQPVWKLHHAEDIEWQTCLTPERKNLKLRTSRLCLWIWSYVFKTSQWTSIDCGYWSIYICWTRERETRFTSGMWGFEPEFLLKQEQCSRSLLSSAWGVGAKHPWSKSKRRLKWKTQTWRVWRAPESSFRDEEMFYLSNKSSIQRLFVDRALRNRFFVLTSFSQACVLYIHHRTWLLYSPADI